MPRELTTLQIIARVRSVFARHWIDQGFVTILYNRGTIRLQGRLQKLQEAGDPIDEQLLNIIDQEIRQVQGVKRVGFNLENWVKTSSGWQKLDKRRTVSRGGIDAVVEVHTDEEEDEEGEQEEESSEEKA